MSQQKAIVITGGTGLVGTRFIELFGTDHLIYIFTRSSRADTDQVKYIKWDVDKQWVDIDKLPTKTDVLINLVGAGIADKRWTDERKKVLIDSRVKATELLYQTYKDQSIETYIGASATGYYGDRGEEILTADAPAGKEGFLSECCVLWEESHQAIKSIATNHYIARIGIVLSSQGGALPKLSLPTKLGGAGYFGDGQMYYSWIHIDDLCRSMQYLIDETPASRVYNAVSPEPIKLKELMRAVKGVYAKYALLMPIPVFGVKLAMGEMVTMLTNSNRVTPNHLIEAGYQYQYGDVNEALQHIKSNNI